MRGATLILQTYRRRCTVYALQLEMFLLVEKKCTDRSIVLNERSNFSPVNIWTATHGLSATTGNVWHVAVIIIMISKVFINFFIILAFVAHCLIDYLSVRNCSSNSFRVIWSSTLSVDGKRTMKREVRGMEPPTKEGRGRVVRRRREGAGGGAPPPPMT